MSIKEIMSGVNPEEIERRMKAVDQINRLWYKKQSCDDKNMIKRIEKKIGAIILQEQSWLKPVAYFLY